MTAVRTLRRGEAVALSALSGSRRAPDDLLVQVSGAGAAPDVVALVLGADGRVRGDDDLVFFNQPGAAGDAVTVDAAAGTARIRTGGLEDTAARVLVGCAGGALDAGVGERLRVDVSHPRQGVLATAVIDVDRLHRAETVLEVYRWGTGWRLRLLGEGYASGLEGLARDHGVQVDGAADAPVPPTPAPPVPPTSVFAAVPPPAESSFGSFGSSFAAPPPAAWTPTPVPPPTRTPGRRPKGRRKAVLVGAGALALVAVVVGAAVSGGDPQPQPAAVALPATPSAASTSASPTVSATPLPAASTAAVPVTSAAQTMLALLPVKGRAPQTGYDRSQFGQTWADVDRNGCDKRVICT